ncbi:unnamed protein product [Parajaminaea phylloscopi]
MKVIVQDWSAVATWVWDVRDPDDVCGICQNNFDGVCGSCKTPRGGDECPLLFGECSHVFHMHCILKWLQGDAGDLCPMCKRQWVAASATAYQADLDAKADGEQQEGEQAGNAPVERLS